MYKTLNLSSDIKLIVSDFDGIFTDNSVYILNETSRLKKLSYKDLMGVSIAVKNGKSISLSYEALYSNLINTFESKFTVNHPEFNYYKDKITAIPL